MARSSPAVGRVVAILNFIADHPGQSFTLTDLVRALRLSRATCHGLLTGLVEAGYLYRSNDKSYLLGPALIAMGEVAKAHFSPMQVTQPEMRALADEYDALCAACFLEGTDTVIKDRAAAASQVGASTRRGSRLPLLAQFASVFFVWSPPSEVNAWLESLDPEPRKDKRDAMLKGIDVIRERGFGVSARHGEWSEGPTPLDQRASIEVLETTMFPVFDIDPDADYHLASMQGPVYDSRRRVAFVLALSGFKGSYKGSEVTRIGERLRETCERVSSFISRIPADSF